MSAPQPGYKRCPDCAEDVREEARRCRFCGYSFERRPAIPWAEWLRRSPSSAPSATELLEGWGADLGPGEEPERLYYCRLAETPGYLALTPRRVLFFTARRPRCLLELDRGELSVERRPGRFGGGSLLLHGGGETAVLGGFTSRRDLDDLAARLALSPS